jgi:uncharacterized protein YndB with AHSA1/START domain
MDSTPGPHCLRIVRRFGVPPEKVFDALTNPDDMRIWWGEDTAFDIDLRVGRRWTITRRQDGTEYVATGQYLAVERPRRLSYTYAMTQFSPNTDTITVEIAPDGGGCVVTFVQSGEDIASDFGRFRPVARPAVRRAGSRGSTSWPRRGPSRPNLALHLTGWARRLSATCNPPSPAGRQASAGRTGPGESHSGPPEP